MNEEFGCEQLDTKHVATEASHAASNGMYFHTRKQESISTDLFLAPSLALLSPIDNSETIQLPRNVTGCGQSSNFCQYNIPACANHLSQAGSTEISFTSHRNSGQPRWSLWYAWLALSECIQFLEMTS